MRDGALKWSLRLLGIALVIVPIIVALSASDWDVKKAVLPSEQELNQISGSVSEIFGEGFTEDTLLLGQPTLSGGLVNLPVTFKSPFKVPIKLKELTLTVSDQGMQTIQLHMEDGELEIPANGTVTFRLVGPVPAAPPSNPEVTAISVVFEIYGVTISFNQRVSEGRL